ncbi:MULTISPECIES: hypothetical protein [Delftia]|uniref:Uncharacterized protein n=1 Tax=Delftia acidovorans TaxID=80866 RepID=A0A7T2W1R6_DELAC|nr:MULTISPECIES: hypothetical protein [Delftia]QPS11606.1 hypothetical protein I6G66_24705 [Delftia acidovorans]
MGEFPGTVISTGIEMLAVSGENTPPARALLFIMAAASPMSNASRLACDKDGRLKERGMFPMNPIAVE